MSKWVRATVILCSVGVMLTATASRAAIEDGQSLCSDGFDNDFDGITDCSEVACRSSNPACTLLPGGPIVVGTGVDDDGLTFDGPDASPFAVVSTGARSLFAVDIDGAGQERDDLIISSTTTASVFRSIRSTAKLSLPQSPNSTPSVIANAQLAAGDWDANGRGDFVAVNNTGLQRYSGSTTGVYSASLPFITASPGPAGGLPAVVGAAVVVANTRLRVYRAGCTVVPTGFPFSETFGGTNALCDSLDLPGTAIAKQILGFKNSTGRSFVGVVTDNTSLSLFEILDEVVGSDRHVRFALRATQSLSATVNDLAFTTNSDLLVVARQDGLLRGVPRRHRRVEPAARAHRAARGGGGGVGARAAQPPRLQPRRRHPCGH